MIWTPARLDSIRSRVIAAMRHMGDEAVPLASVMWCLASMGALYLATAAWERALYRAGAAPLRPFFEVLSDIWSRTNDPPLGVIDGGPEETN